MDRTLVERAIQGDEDAYAGLMAIAGDRLLAIAYRILRDLHRAEDAVQVALVNAWRDLPTLRDADRFEAWLTRILVRACYLEADRGRRWNANMRVLPIDIAGTSDPTSDRRRSGSPGSRLPASSDRPTGDRRAPSLPGMESARDRPRPRDSHRDRQVPPLLCHPGPSRRHRGGRPGHQRGATGMTTNDDFDRQIQAYLESGPAELSDRVLWAARAQLKTTRRRRAGFAWLAPWRNTNMTRNTRLMLVGGGVARRGDRRRPRRVDPRATEPRAGRLGGAIGTGGISAPCRPHRAPRWRPARARPSFQRGRPGGPPPGR